jgi:electron transfer flavoprotein alpha subunit
MSNIVVFVEQQNGSARQAGLEALGAAHSTGHTVVAVVTGPQAIDAAPQLGTFGASKVVVITGADAYSPDGNARDVTDVVRSEQAIAFFTAASSMGKDLLPRVAAMLDCTTFSDCTGLSCAGTTFTIVRPMLAGKVIATMQTTSAAMCASLRPNVFAAVDVGGTATVVQVPANPARKVVVVQLSAKSSAKLDVKEAPVVVSGGRGLKAPEHFKLVEDLAAAFGNAAVGASRAVVDAGWRPHSEQVGQTGKTVQPLLYIAVGISGAIQHLAGMRTAKTIVAINKDPAAPIFKVADYGLVGDAFEVLPVLTEAVRKIKAKR